MREYIVDCLRSGNYIRSSNSEEVRVNCPSCGDIKHHLYINIVKRPIVFFCQRCRYSGALLEDVEILGQEEFYPSNIFVGELPEGSFRMDEGDNKVRNDAWKYIYKRGLDWRDVKNHNIYYCISGKYRRRIIFPIVEASKLVYFVARAIDEDVERKVYNPKGEKELFNLEWAVRYSRIALVEGVFDAVKTGFNAVAILGSYVTDHQIKKMKDFEVQYVDIMFDADEAGKQGAIDSARKMYRHFREVRIINIPFGEPDNLNLRKISYINSWIKAKLSITMYSVIMELDGIRIRR